MQGLSMEGIASPRAAAFPFFNPSSTQLPSQGSNGGGLAASFGDLASLLQEKLGSNGGGYAEVSVRARMTESFNASMALSGPQGQKMSLYASGSRSMEFSADFRVSQAQDIVAAHQGAATDFGPEATAGRIADFALSFFPQFAAQHSDMSFEEQVAAYRDLVKGAVDSGFKEALGMLGDLPQEVSDQIGQTRSLVDQKLDSFFDYLQGQGSAGGAKAASDGNWKSFVDNFFASQNQPQQQAA